MEVDGGDDGMFQGVKDPLKGPKSWGRGGECSLSRTTKKGI